MKIARTIEEVRDSVNRCKREGRSIGLVPTMGFLHKFQATSRTIREDIAPEDCVLRFASWLFGEDFTPEDTERLMKAMEKRLTPDGKVPAELRGIRGMLYVDYSLKY